VDGRPQPIFYTNVAFRGLPVPAGTHRILMRFEAPLFWWAAAASALAWFVWAALLFRARRTVSGNPWSATRRHPS
jgi:hypothetical protein